MQNVIREARASDALNEYSIQFISFSENKKTYFQTIIKAMPGGSEIFWTAPELSYKNARDQFNYALRKTHETINLPPHVVYKLVKESSFK